MSVITRLLATKVGLSNESGTILANLDDYLGPDAELDNGDLDYLAELIAYMQCLDLRMW